MKITIIFAVLCWFLSANAIAETPGIPIQNLISQYKKLNEKCRGGPGDDPATMVSCNQREKLYQDILKAGWCLGPKDAPGYQKDWMQCPMKETIQTAQTATTKALDLNKAIETISKTVMMSPGAKNIKAEWNGSSYSLTVYYNSDVDVQADTRLLAIAFVRYLVSIGRDPTDAASRRPVHVCGLQDGLTTVSGKPGVSILGCSHYNPYKDTISWEGP